MNPDDLPSGVCVDVFNHSQILWPHAPEGVTVACPIDNPFRRDIGSPSWYWDYGVGINTAFDDVAREAHEYDLSDEFIQVRPYTDEENARADYIQGTTALVEAQTNLMRAVPLNAAPEELAAVQELTLQAEGIEPGDPWRQPTGAEDAYPLGAIVSHVDKLWESTVAANVWEPGVSGWRETGVTCPEFVQPTGAHDAYNTGDCVTFEGACYVSTMDANVWSPTDLPSGWEETDCD